MTHESHLNTENGNGNGHGPGGGGMHEPEFDSIFLSDAPEVVTGNPSGSDTEERRVQLVNEEGDIASGVETDRGAHPEARGRKRVVGALFGVVVLVIGGVVLYFMFGAGGTRKAKVSVNAGGNSQQEREDELTRQAINQVRAPGVSMGDGTVIQPQPSPYDPQQQVTQPVTEQVTQYPGNGNLSATVGPTPSASSNSTDSQTQSTTISKVVAPSERNNERSWRLGEDVSTTPRREPAKPRSENDPAASAGVTVPSFGSMLPVRSLGAIFTLRSGGLARFELTRDVKGKGWSLPRGTVLVGALRGSEFDRAYLSLIGFIDSESGKFVKVSGDVLGPDGGSGVKGKRRKMTSSWSRVLAKLGEAGLNITGTLAGSVGRRPVVITDAFGGVGYRVTNEFDGVLQNKDKNVFVEIPAGTNCYMMITELPESIQGVDAVARLSRRDVETIADADEPRTGTGLSEHELAELLQSGDPERIKAAMPRMTSEMKRVAQAVVSQSED